MTTIQLTTNNKQKNYVYRSNHTCTLLATYSLWIFLFLISLAFALGTYTLISMNFELLNTGGIAKEFYLQLVNMYVLAFGCSIIFSILSTIIFLCWTYGVSVNTHAFNPEKKMEFSPGWCVGSCFIPFFNLYLPYKAMKELWVLNIGSETKLISSWWILSLVFKFVVSDPSNLSINSDLNGYLIMSLASNLCGIISAYNALKIIRKINAAQKSKAHEFLLIENTESAA